MCCIVFVVVYNEIAQKSQYKNEKNKRPSMSNLSGLKQQFTFPLSGPLKKQQVDADASALIVCGRNGVDAE